MRRGELERPRAFDAPYERERLEPFVIRRLFAPNVPRRHHPRTVKFSANKRGNADAKRTRPFTDIART
jgi:hypothetical protein